MRNGLRTVRCAAAATAMWAAAAAVQPAPPAGPDGTTRPAATRPAAGREELARQFLAAGKEALRRRDPAKAIEALTQAVRYDGDLLEARYRLGRAYHMAGRARDAGEQYKAFAAAARRRTELTPTESAWQAEVAERLRRLYAFLRLWEKLRADYAEQFRKLAAGRGGTPSCVRALEAAVALSPGDDEAAGELTAARKLVSDVLPPPPEEPNPTGAKLLIEQAEAKRRAGRHEEALKLLRSACVLSREPSTVVALAEAYAAAKSPAEAAVAAAEARRMLADAPEHERRRYEKRLDQLIEAGDPDAERVEERLGRFAEEAEALARRACGGKDSHTAAEILEVVVEFAPGRESAAELLRKVRKAVSGFASLAGISGKRVGCRARPRGCRVNRYRNTVELRWGDSKAPRTAGVTLTFHGTRWGRQLRARWRIEDLDAGRVARTTLTARFWPVHGGASLAGRRRTWGWWLFDEADQKVVKTPEAKARRAMFKPEADGYTLSFEKADRLLTVRVDGTLLLQAELTEAGLKACRAGRPMTFELALGLPAESGDGSVRIRLLNSSCSPDCFEKDSDAR